MSTPADEGAEAVRIDLEAAAWRCLTSSPRFKDMKVCEAIQEMFKNGFITGEPIKDLLPTQEEFRDVVQNALDMHLEGRNDDEFRNCVLNLMCGWPVGGAFAYDSRTRELIAHWAPAYNTRNEHTYKLRIKVEVVE